MGPLLVLNPFIIGARHRIVRFFMGEIRVAIAGLGGCGSAIVQGIYYYQNAKEDEFVPGLMHVKFGDYHIRDVKFVAVFDVNKEKIGKEKGSSQFL